MRQNRACNKDMKNRVARNIQSHSKKKSEHEKKTFFFCRLSVHSTRLQLHATSDWFYVAMDIGKGHEKMNHQILEITDNNGQRIPVD